MKRPKSLKITDVHVGTGRRVVPGDVVVCRCRCTRNQGDLVFASPEQEPYVVHVGARDSCVGIEYGLLGMQQGGIRSIQVPPNLTYVERKIYGTIPADALLIYELELLGFQEPWDAAMEGRLASPSVELSETLIHNSQVRIERIVSHGHFSPPDFWYDQDENEFVLVVQGAARLRFEDGAVDLSPGDWLNIPSHRRHRVDWTAPNERTVWLAVFYRD